MLGTRIRMTTEGLNRRPVWTPDGSRIAFQSEAPGGFDLPWQAADGSSERELLLERSGAQFPDAWTPDGRFLMGVQSEPETQEFRVVLNWFDELKRLVPVD